MDMWDKIYDYVSNAIDSFGNDPADSDYQRGYEACLVDTREELLRIIAKENA